jgi:DNA-binding GntR family transcriptional regulator
MIPRRGAEVAQITEKSMKDVLEVRKVLDDLSVELACERITEEEKELLKNACVDFEEAVKTGDFARIAKTDVAFHDIIVTATRNIRLSQMVNNLAEQMYRYRFEYIKDSTQHARLVQEHEEICQGIIAGDKKRALEAIEKHIDNQEIAVLKQIRIDRDKKV